MIAAELRGGNKPSLNEALGWIGSRVDDIYGANVGRLEDVWIDPGTGAPRWLLVKEGRFGGRTTLIPFEDATAGAGHVWVPYEREIVRDAPEIEPGAPLTQQVEAALRSHYAANVPPAIAHAGSGAGAPAPEQPGPQQEHRPADPVAPPAATATLRFATGGAQPTPPPSFGAPQPPPAAEESQRTEYRPPAPAPRRPVLREQPAPQQQPKPQGAPAQGMPPGLPPRPAPPIAAPPTQQQSNPYAYPQPYPQQPPQQQQQQAPPPQQPPPGYAYPSPGYQQPQPYPPAPRPAPPQGWQQQGGWQQPPPPQPPAPQPNPVEMLNSLTSSSQVHYVEIELSGELSIRGELRSLRVIPRDQGPGYNG